jgi:ribosomal protein S18 acetylase RimI-like enzyme
MREHARRVSARAWITSGATVTIKTYARRYGVDRYTADEMPSPCPGRPPPAGPRPPTVFHDHAALHVGPAGIVDLRRLDPGDEVVLGLVAARSLELEPHPTKVHRFAHDAEAEPRFLSHLTTSSLMQERAGWRRVRRADRLDRETVGVDPVPVLRPASPDDYEPIVAVADEWWGRPVAQVLPRLFLDHFHRTSLIAETDRQLTGFLIGFLSPSLPDEAYIHFLGVSPAQRRCGIARTLYERFFDLVRADGRGCVRAVTSPVNAASIAFHQSLGFTVTHPTAPVHDNHVRFTIRLR